MNKKAGPNESIRTEIKEIVLARLDTLDKESKIMLLGFKEPLSIKQLMEEIRNDTKFGRKVLDVQYEFLKALARGEI